MESVDEFKNKSDKESKKEKELPDCRQVPESFPKRCIHDSFAGNAHRPRFGLVYNTGMLQPCCYSHAIVEPEDESFVMIVSRVR